MVIVTVIIMQERLVEEKALITINTGITLLILLTVAFSLVMDLSQGMVSVGYPYGANFFGGGFPFGGYNGIGYGVTSLAPRSPWIRGGLLPYDNYPIVYPTYLNGGVGIMGIGTNGYDGTGQMGINGEVSQAGSTGAVEMNALDMAGSESGDAQVAVDGMMNGETVNVKSSVIGGSDGDSSSNGNEEAIDGQLQPR